MDRVRERRGEGRGSDYADELDAVQPSKATYALCYKQKRPCRLCRCRKGLRLGAGFCLSSAQADCHPTSDKLHFSHESKIQNKALCNLQNRKRGNGRRQFAVKGRTGARVMPSANLLPFTLA